MSRQPSPSRSGCCGGRGRPTASSRSWLFLFWPQMHDPPAEPEPVNRKGGVAISVDRPLQCDGGCFPAADAQRSNAALQIMRLKRMQQRDDEACARRADGMAKRARPAIDVQLLAGNAEVALSRNGHHCERLLDLEQIDVADAPARLVEQ